MEGYDSERCLQGEHPGCSQILYFDFSLLEDSSVNVSLIYLVETLSIMYRSVTRTNNRQHSYQIFGRSTAGVSRRNRFG